MSSLTLTAKSSSGTVTAPFFETKSFPAVAIHWNGTDWYNPLVLPDDANATTFRVRHGGTTYALSAGTSDETGSGIPLLIEGNDYLQTWYLYNGETAEEIEDLPEDAEYWDKLVIDYQGNMYYPYEAYDDDIDYETGTYVKAWWFWIHDGYYTDGEDHDGYFGSGWFSMNTTKEEYERFQAWISAGNAAKDWDTGYTKENPPDPRLSDKTPWGTYKGETSYVSMQYIFQSCDFNEEAETISFCTDVLATSFDRQGNHFAIVAQYDYGENETARLVNKFFGKYEDRTLREIQNMQRGGVDSGANGRRLRSVEVCKNGEVIHTVDLSTFFEDEFLKDATLPQHLKTTATSSNENEQNAIDKYNAGYNEYDCNYNANFGVVNAFIEDENTWYFLLEGDLKITAANDVYHNYLESYTVMKGSGYSFPNDEDRGTQDVVRDITGRSAMFYFDKSGKRTMYNLVRGKVFNLYNMHSELYVSGQTGWVDEYVWTYPDLDTIRFPMPDGYYYTASLLPGDHYHLLECYYPETLEYPDRSDVFTTTLERMGLLGFELPRHVFKYSFFTPTGKKIFEIATTPRAHFVITKMGSKYIFSTHFGVGIVAGDLSRETGTDYTYFIPVYNGVITPNNKNLTLPSKAFPSGVYSYKDGEFTKIVYGDCFNQQLRPIKNLNDLQNRIQMIEVAQGTAIVKPPSSAFVFTF